MSADRLLVGEGATAVQIQIDAGGLPVKIEATTIDEDVRGGKQPTRIGIDLAEPVEQAGPAIEPATILRPAIRLETHPDAAAGSQSGLPCSGGLGQR